MHVATAGSCECDAAWLGETCSRLALLPAPRDAGYRRSDAGGLVSSWGGSVLQRNGTWHMFVAEVGRARARARSPLPR